LLPQKSNLTETIDLVARDTAPLVDALGEGLGREGLVQEVDGLGLYDADDNDPTLPSDDD